MLSDELVERVAKAIHDVEPCSNDVEMNDALFVGTMFDCRMRQARAALEAAGVSRMMEALIEARKVVASDADACEAFGPNEFSEPHRVLSIIDEALGSVTV